MALRELRLRVPRSLIIEVVALPLPLRGAVEGARYCEICFQIGLVSLILLDKVRFELEETVVQLKPGSRGTKHRFKGWRGPVVLLTTLVGVFALILLWAKHGGHFGLLLEHSWLFPVGLVALVYIIGRFFPVLARKKRLSAAHVATPQLASSAVTVSGKAQRLDRDVDGHGTGRALVSSLILGPPKGRGVYLGSLRGADFLLLLDDERRVVVTGELFVPETLHQVHDDAAVPAVKGLPKQACARHWQLRDGDRITLRGSLTQEASTALPAGYRSDGFVDTLRGNAGHPVVVQSARTAEGE
jgi:hypothetical protein